MAIFGEFLRPAFPASRVQQVSDLHPKFALRPHLCGSMVDIQSTAAEIRRGENKEERTRMWANAQRDGRPAEYRWRPLFNAAVWLTPSTTVPCSNATKTRNPLKLPGLPQTNEKISAASGPKVTILCRHVEEILLLNKFFFRLSIRALVPKI